MSKKNKIGGLALAGALLLTCAAAGTIAKYQTELGCKGNRNREYIRGDCRRNDYCKNGKYIRTNRAGNYRK